MKSASQCNGERRRLCDAGHDAMQHVTRSLSAWARLHLRKWARLWRCRPLASVKCAVNPRLTVSLGRCRPAARAIELNQRLLSHTGHLRREVLCHEAAHFAVRELHGRVASRTVRNGGSS